MHSGTRAAQAPRALTLVQPRTRLAHQQVQEAAASKLLDGGQIDGRMTATLTYPSGSGSTLAAGAIGRMEADLRHEGLWPTTHFIATGSK